jgi:hypothetical protein
MANLTRDLRRLARSELVALHPPSPEHLWWKAKIVRRRAAREQALRPLCVAQLIAPITLATALAIAFVLRLPAVGRWLTGGLADSGAETLGSGHVGLFVVVALGVSILLCGGLVLRSILPDRI